MRTRVIVFFLLLYLSNNIFAQRWLSSTTISGLNDEFSEQIVSDEQHNTYISGCYLGNINFGATSSFVSLKETTMDIFLVKYDEDGNVVWTNTIGGIGDDRMSYIALVDDGILVAGSFSSTCYFEENDSEPLISGGTMDMFLAKYDRETGVLLWKKHLVETTTSMILGYSLTVDLSGNILVAGRVMGGADATFHPNTNSVVPAGAGFVAKLDNNGDYLWHVTLSSVISLATMVATETDYYFSGTSKGNVTFADRFAVNTAITPDNTNVSFFYLIAISPDGAFKWVEKSSSAGATSAQRLTIDPQGNLYLGGLYANSDLTFAGQSLNLTNSGGNDIFLFSVMPSGTSIDRNNIVGTSVSSSGREFLYGLELRDSLMYVSGKLGNTVSFNDEVVPAGMFVSAYNIQDRTLGFEVIGAVPGLVGATDAKGIVFSPMGFTVVGGYTTAELSIGDNTYTNGGPAGKSDVYLARAALICDLHLSVTHVQECDATLKTGALRVKVRGVSPDLFLLKKNGVIIASQTTNFFENLEYGNYTIEMLYSDGSCSIARDFTINAPNAIAIKNIVLTEPSCDALPLTGTITVEVESALNDLVYRAVGTSVGQNATEIYNHTSDESSYFNNGVFQNCPMGNYVITVSRAADVDCFVSQSVSLSATATEGYLQHVVTDNQCNPANQPPTGNVTVSVTDFNDPMDYFIAIDIQTGVVVQTTVDGQGSIAADGLSCTFINMLPGSYYFKAGSYSSDCVLESDKNIPAVFANKPAILINSVKPQNVLCKGNATGTITVSASGGSTLSYTLLNGDNSSNSNTTGSTSGIFTGLTANSYHIVVEDNASCTETISNIIIHEPEVETLLSAETRDACSGMPTGRIRLTATGLSNYRVYTINNGSTPVSNITGEFYGLAKATYSASVFDQYSQCTTTYSNEDRNNEIKIDYLPQVGFTATPTNVLCYGGSTGAITLSNFTGGSGKDYTAVITEGATLISTLTEAPYTVSDLSAGTYTITVTDSYGCSYVRNNVTVGQPAALTVDEPVREQVNCNGKNTGKITITAQGGTGTYHYTLYDVSSDEQVGEANTNGVFGSLVAGTYRVEVIDDNGCSANRSNIVITEPDAIVITVESQSNVQCFGSNDGSIEISAEGGTGTLSYRIRNAAGGNPQTPQSNGEFTSLKAGKYVIEVSDASSCTQKSEEITITQPATGLSLGTPAPTSVKCFGGSDGQINITAQDGATPYSYVLTNASDQVVGEPNDNGTFDNLSAGTYKVTVTDANSCTATRSDIVVSEPEQISFVGEPVLTAVKCFGGSDGQITITAQGGTIPYSYVLKDASDQEVQGSNNNGTFANLSIGTYKVTVTDQNGCEHTSGEITIIQPVAALSFDTPAFTDVKCFGVNDGSIEVSATGGTGSIEYSINGGASYQSSGTFTGLAADTYTIIARDVNGCIVPLSGIVVDQPEQITFGEPDVTAVKCFDGNDGQIIIIAQGGTPSYTYTLMDASDRQIGESKANGVFGSLSAGTYKIMARDVNGCTATKSGIVVDRPAQITFDTPKVIAVKCFGGSDGSIEVSATGGIGLIEYSINGGAYQSSSTFTGLAAGTYTITARDANSCTVPLSGIVVDQPAQITFGIPVVTAVNCFGDSDGSIQVLVSGGTTPMTYSINDGASYQLSDLFTGLAAGSYTIRTKDANGCELTSGAIEVKEPTELVLGTPVPTDVKCFDGNDGSIQVSATGGTAPIEYSIDGSTYQPSNVFMGLRAGAYTVTARDVNGCLATGSEVVVGEPEQLVFGTSEIANVKCFGEKTGSIRVLTSGGIAPMTYSINGGAYQPADLFSGLAAGAYTVTVRDDNGCEQSSASTEVTQPTQLIVSAAAQSKWVSCNPGSDGAITVVAAGGVGNYRYKTDATAYDPSNVIGNLPEANYMITVIDGNNCELTDQQPVVVSVVDNPELTVDGSNIKCFGGTGTITASATAEDDYGIAGSIRYYQLYKDDSKYSGEITGSTFSDNELSAGNYTMLAVDGYGCETRKDVTVSGPSVALSFSLKSYTEPFGNTAGAITVTAAGGWGDYTIKCNKMAGNFSTTLYTLTNQSAGDYTFDDLTVGDYQIIISDKEGCEGQSVVQSLKIATGVSEMEASVRVKVYPNPFTEEVRLESAEEGSILRVYNAAGVLVHTQKIIDPNGPIHLGHLPAGTYIFRLEKNKKIRVEKATKR